VATILATILAVTVVSQVGAAQIKEAKIAEV
jgi:hypothetical protein